jgi:hypothetical protein
MADRDGRNGFVNALQTFINFLLVDHCPRCGSGNVHNCQVKAPIVEGSVSPFLNSVFGETNCPVAKEVDDPRAGHCDDCGYLWCLRCNSEMSLKEPRCGCWSICGECPENYFNSKAPACSYPGMEDICPRITAWKCAVRRKG